MVFYALDFSLISGVWSGIVAKPVVPEENHPPLAIDQANFLTLRSAQAGFEHWDVVIKINVRFRYALDTGMREGGHNDIILIHAYRHYFSKNKQNVAFYEI